VLALEKQKPNRAGKRGSASLRLRQGGDEAQLER